MIAPMMSMTQANNLIALRAEHRFKGAELNSWGKGTGVIENELTMRMM
jgi:hypothetical protein